MHLPHVCSCVFYKTWENLDWQPFGTDVSLIARAPNTSCQVWTVLNNCCVVTDHSIHIICEDFRMLHTSTVLTAVYWIMFVCTLSHGCSTQKLMWEYVFDNIFGSLVWTEGRVLRCLSPISWSLQLTIAVSSPSPLMSDILTWRHMQYIMVYMKVVEDRWMDGNVAYF